MGAVFVWACPSDLKMRHIGRNLPPDTAHNQVRERCFVTSAVYVYVYRPIGSFMT
jgi:hypothetical protein